MRRLALLLALGTVALAPAGAHASIAYMDENGVPTAEGEPGQTNEMTARAGEDGVIFSDTAGIRPRDDFGCRALSDTEVTCIGGEGGLLLGRDGNDRLVDAGTTGGFGARGGSGDDTIVAGTVDAILFGDDKDTSASDGDDTITGSSATALDPAQPTDFNDMINGGGGNDVIDAGPGSDTVSGDGGRDTVHGGDGGDWIDSSDSFTDSGEDAPGDAGDDMLYGDAGNDQLNGHLGRDKLNGGDGDDFLIASDWDIGEDDKSSDALACGAGADRVAPGHADKVAVGCERLLVSMYCTGGYPCSAKGTVSGRKKGAKMRTVVAKLSTTVDSPEPVEFALGKKATKLLGSAKKVSLFGEVVGRRGKQVVSSRFLNFTLTK